MMKKSTVQSLLKELKSIEKSGLTISTYCKKNNISVSKYYDGVNALREEPYDELTEEVIHLYDSLLMRKTEDTDTDDRAVINIIRDENGKISKYYFKIFRRDKTPVEGYFSRDEMNNIYRMYSYYGASLTQKQVSRLFPEYTLVDFKRILRAFNITKASACFAPHVLEEHTQEELLDMQFREKENNFLKKIEENRVRDTEILLKQYAKENYELKDQLNRVNNISVSLNETHFTPVEFSKESSNKDIILHLSDLHVGARVDGILYDNTWNEKELYRRLDSLTSRVGKLGPYNNIIINLLGDHLDGYDEMTCSRTHMLPQNMNNTEQVNTFINSIISFIYKLVPLTKNISVYCVKCGNHAGDFEYVANLALMSTIKNVYPSITTTLFDKFIGYYYFNDHIFLLSHGKAPRDMKKPLPLNLQDSTKIKLYEYLNVNNIIGDNIHFIKGDLHTENINSCERLDYRNVLSLFGASDYSFLNYSRNQYGCSYEYFIGDNLLRGTFENL